MHKTLPSLFKIRTSQDSKTKVSANEKSKSPNSESGPVSSSDNSDSSKIARAETGSDSFLKSVVMDASASVDWSFFNPDYFRLNCRGGNAMIHAKYEGESIQPGVGAYFRYDAGTKNFQFPLVLTLTFNEFFRIFAGPIVSIGKPKLPGNSEQKIKNSFFPGIIGVTFSTPSFKIGKTLVSFVQDIHYTVFNDTDGAALSFNKSVTSGIVFATGLRVTLPLKSVL